MSETEKKEKKGNSWRVISGILAILLLISILTNGFGGSCSSQEENKNQDSDNQIVVEDKEDVVLDKLTFTVNDNEICKEDGKPIIRLFSTTWCPHCKWIGGTYEKVVKEYVDKGEIVAHHWEIDIKDDTLTPENEGTIPDSEMAVYREFNPRGSIPTFVFGCKYSRIGNGYESENNLEKEEAEFRQIIEALIAG